MLICIILDVYILLVFGKACGFILDTYASCIFGESIWLYSGHRSEMFLEKHMFHSACIPDIFSEKPEFLNVSGNILPVVFWKAKVEPLPSKHGRQILSLVVEIANTASYSHKD